MDDKEEVRKIDEALALVTVDSMEDWFLIERAEHDGSSWMEPYDFNGSRGFSFMTSARITNADIEGTSGEMLDIAQAIRDRTEAGARRCAVKVDGDRAELWSPRNSSFRASVPLSVADALAEQIEKKLGE